MSYLEDLRRQHVERRRSFEEKGVADFGINLRGPVITRRPREKEIIDDDVKEAPVGYLTTHLLDGLDPPPAPLKYRPLSRKKCLDQLLTLLGEYHSEEVMVNIHRKVKSKRYVIARWHYYFLARMVINAGWSEIGKRIKKDHSCVIVGLRRMSERCNTDFDIAQEMAELELKLRKRIGLEKTDVIEV